MYLMSISRVVLNKKNFHGFHGSVIHDKNRFTVPILSSQKNEINT
jgi:hypothetical protein